MSATRDASSASQLVIVESSQVSPGRPRIRINRAMPDWVSPEVAVRMARERAERVRSHRFQVLEHPAGGAEPRVLWDSHAPS